MDQKMKKTIVKFVIGAALILLSPFMDASPYFSQGEAFAFGTLSFFAAVVFRRVPQKVYWSIYGCIAALLLIDILADYFRAKGGPNAGPVPPVGEFLWDSLVSGGFNILLLSAGFFVVTLLVTNRYRRKQV